MAVNIEGLLRHYRRKKINILVNDDGRTITDKEARAYLAECQAKGYKLIPRDGCDGFDPFDKGCPGHPVQEDEIRPC